MLDTNLDELVARAKADPEFPEVDRKVAESGILTWLEPDEKALLYGVGAFAPGGGSIVEVGAFEGGSACFLAGGLARRGEGTLHSIDPHLGAPPWFGLAPHKRTLKAFQRAVGRCGLEPWVVSHLSDSASLSAVWPGEPIDAVFIDGDHSFLGALGDFECWAPKVVPGGLILFDDVAGTLSELDEAVDLVKSLRSVCYLGSVDGIAAFRRNEVYSWAMLGELSAELGSRRVHRPWDLAPLHGTALPANYREPGPWPSFEIGEAYMITFFARCGPGPYGFTSASPREDRVFLEALSRDRRDGDLVALNGLGERFRARFGRPTAGFRAILCHPEEVTTYAPRLATGGVLLARHDLPPGPESTLKVRQTLLDAGLSGCGCTDSLHWGIWQPNLLSPEAVLHHAIAHHAAPTAVNPPHKAHATARVG
jgi:predicted O-methyltransferase YrrM